MSTNAIDFVPLGTILIPFTVTVGGRTITLERPVPRQSMQSPKRVKRELVVPNAPKRPKRTDTREHAVIDCKLRYLSPPPIRRTTPAAPAAPRVARHIRAAVDPSCIRNLFQTDKH